MGKGNRTRNERAANVLATATPRQASKKKKGMPTWAGTAIVIAVLVVLVLFVTFIVLNSRGTFLRMRTFAESENYEVTVPMMSYMVYTEYQNRVSLYEQYSEQIGSSIQIGGGEGGDALDTSVGLRDQTYGLLELNDGTVLTEATWFDYFANTAEKDVRQILACCEAARLYGMALDDADHDAIEAELDTIEQYAATYGYTTNGYVSIMYGQGVILKDVRAMMELTELATKWSEFKAEEFRNAVTDGRIDEYYAANKDTYDIYCDYSAYTFTAEFKPSENSDATAAATENAAAAEKYQAEQERFAGYVETLITATGSEDFRVKLYQCLYAEEQIKAKEKKGSDLTDAEKAECSATAEQAALEAIFTNMSEDDIDDDNDLSDWLFETKTENEVKTFVRKAGETKKLEDTNDVVTEGEEAYEEVSSTYSAYIFNGGMHPNTDLLRSVGHILFKSDTYDGKTSTDGFTGVIKEIADKVLARDGIITSYSMAGELLDMLYAEGKITEATRQDGSKYYKIDEAVFEDYGNLYTEDSSVFYDNVYKGQMVEEFENWLFDATRVEGEITYSEPIKTEYGYHIMYYVGDEIQTWKNEIRTTLSDEENTAYLEGLQGTHPVTVNSDYYRYIQG